MRKWALPAVAGVSMALLGAAVVSGAASAPVEAQQRATAEAPASPRSAHDFTMTRIDGRPMPFSQFRGQVMLVVNTASMCGFTPQYEGLQKLQTQYAGRGFTVLGVPSGDFMGQEYDDNAQIKKFCETKFGVNFPMTEKSSVRGDKAAPFYRWARTQVAENNEPKWNFHKFLVGRDGRIIAGFGSKVTPESPEMKRAIEAALAQPGRKT